MFSESAFASLCCYYLDFVGSTSLRGVCPRLWGLFDVLSLPVPPCPFPFPTFSIPILKKAQHTDRSSPSSLWYSRSTMHAGVASLSNTPEPAVERHEYDTRVWVNWAWRCGEYRARAGVKGQVSEEDLGTRLDTIKRKLLYVERLYSNEDVYESYEFRLLNMCTTPSYPSLTRSYISIPWPSSSVYLFMFWWPRHYLYTRIPILGWLILLIYLLIDVFSVLLNLLLFFLVPSTFTYI